MEDAVEKAKAEIETLDQIGLEESTQKHLRMTKLFLDCSYPGRSGFYRGFSGKKEISQGKVKMIAT